MALKFIKTDVNGKFYKRVGTGNVEFDTGSKSIMVDGVKYGQTKVENVSNDNLCGIKPGDTIDSTILKLINKKLDKLIEIDGSSNYNVICTYNDGNDNPFTKEYFLNKLTGYYNDWLISDYNSIKYICDNEWNTTTPVNVTKECFTALISVSTDLDSNMYNNFDVQIITKYREINVSGYIDSEIIQSLESELEYSKSNFKKLMLSKLSIENPCIIMDKNLYTIWISVLANYDSQDYQNMPTYTVNYLNYVTLDPNYYTQCGYITSKLVLEFSKEYNNVDEYKLSFTLLNSSCDVILPDDVYFAYDFESDKTYGKYNVTIQNGIASYSYITL